jgi:hypothetical protein
MKSQASVPRDVFPPTPPGPEGSNGNGLLRVQWVPGAWLIFPFEPGYKISWPSAYLAIYIAYSRHQELRARKVRHSSLHPSK